MKSLRVCGCVNTINIITEGRMPQSCNKSGLNANMCEIVWFIRVTGCVPQDYRSLCSRYGHSHTRIDPLNANAKGCAVGKAKAKAKVNA